MYILTINNTNAQKFSLEGFQMSYKREDDSPRVRVSPTGDLSFYGDTYDMLSGMKQNDLVTADATLFWDANALVTFLIELAGEWDEAAKVCKLPVMAKDIYNTIKDNIDTELLFEPKKTRPGLYVKHLVRSSIRLMVARFTGTIDTNWPDLEWQRGVWVDNNLPSAWDGSVCYKAARVYSYDGPVLYVGDEVRSFVLYDNKTWVATKDNRATLPGTDQNVWVQTAVQMWRTSQLIAGLPLRSGKSTGSAGGTGGTTIPAYVGKGYAQDAIDNYFVKAAAAPQAPEELVVLAVDLFDILRQLVEKADPNLTINKANYFVALQAIDPRIKELFIYKKQFATSSQQAKQSADTSCDDSKKWKTTLKDILDLYENYFNAHWYIDGNEFKFLHPSDDCVAMPDTTNDRDNFINDYHAKDYSNGVFRDDNLKLGKETWQYSETDESEVVYKNDYTDEVNHSFDKFENDPAHVAMNTKDSFVVVATGAAYTFRGDIYHDVVTDAATDLMNYNSALKSDRLIKTFNAYNRPFTKGLLNDKQQVTLFKKKMSKCQVTYPNIYPQRLNFQKLVVTNYGNLMPEEILVNFNEAAANLKLRK